MHIAFGCDNAASELKRELMELAQSLGHVCHDCGIGEGEANDYPLYAARAARMVQSRAVRAGRSGVRNGRGDVAGVQQNEGNPLRAVLGLLHGPDGPRA